MEATRQSGAGRTFQSLFGSGTELLGADTELLGERILRAKCKREEDEDEVVEDKAEEEEAEVWDDDFPADAEDNNGRAARPKLTQAISAESRRSIEDWADHDDDEDNWKEALQARVDQLELVVGKAGDAASPHGSNNFGASDATVAMPGTPVDQRATLTLLPKTNLSRAVSAPPAPEEHKPPSKLKTPSMVRATTLARDSSMSGAKAASGGAAVAGVDQTGVRKRSNSRDFSARSATLATDQKRLGKAAAAATTTPSNSVFVRAVVARGGSANSRMHAESTRISDDGHAEKRAKSGDRRSSILALSDAEVVRRFILEDVKKISVERIVADAKRLHFLEDVYRRQQQGQSTETKAVASSTSVAGQRHSSPTKKHLV